MIIEINPKLRSALALAAAGFHVFPCKAGTKEPHIKDFPNLATTDERQIREWWRKWPEANPAIAMVGLVAVDVDVKDGARGDLAILELEAEGSDLPITYTQRTPTGGSHLLYRTAIVCANSASKLRQGIDIRGKGGFVLGAGSVVAAGTYTGDLVVPCAEAPDWLVHFAAWEDRRVVGPSTRAPGADDRAVAYLRNLAPAQLHMRNNEAYKAAAQIREFGADEEDCYQAMVSDWRSSPPLGHGELRVCVASVYRTAQRPQGFASPQAEFTPVVVEAPAPPAEDAPIQSIADMNRQYAYALTGSVGTVLYFTKDEEGDAKVEYLAVPTFHQYLAALQVLVPNGDTEKRVPLTQMWMKSHERRTYAGIVFSPGKTPPPRFYNLWTGFAVEPLAPGEAANARSQASLDAFLLHVRENMTGGNQAQAEYILDFFAHMVQKPEKKPQVALVFRGGKGVGKSAATQVLKTILGPHFGSSSNSRYVTGNFNAHMANAMLFVFEEATYSGCKSTESIIKTLVSDPLIQIERKGHDSFQMKSYMRLILIGNAQWQVPASGDERRWAVFTTELRTHKWNTEEARTFFEEMVEGMKAGGSRVLLRFLMDRDISKFQVNQAPQTEGLTQQKDLSLPPFEQWWRERLMEGCIIGSDFGGEWVRDVETKALQKDVAKFFQELNVGGWRPSPVAIGMALKDLCPSIITGQKARDDGGRQVNVYRLPPLAQARADWDKRMNYVTKWPKEIGE